MEDTGKKVKEIIDRYFSTDDTYGARDFVDDIRSIAESDSESEFGQRLALALRTYDTKMSYGVGDLVYAVDCLLNGEAD